MCVIRAVFNTRGNRDRWLLCEEEEETATSLTSCTSSSILASSEAARELSNSDMTEARAHSRWMTAWPLESMSRWDPRRSQWSLSAVPSASFIHRRKAAAERAASSRESSFKQRELLLLLCCSPCCFCWLLYSLLVRTLYCSFASADCSRCFCWKLCSLLLLVTTARFSCCCAESYDGCLQQQDTLRCTAVQQRVSTLRCKTEKGNCGAVCGSSASAAQ